MKTPTTAVSSAMCSTSEDGDGEDLSPTECKIVVEYRHKIESGEINKGVRDRSGIINYLFVNSFDTHS